ncbi:MAG: hypothetical protein H6Q03_1335 [Acidobacteria bacterium]|nr:hypothetical protein [Acidobacteriota bacterium]
MLAAAWSLYAAGTHPRVFTAGNDASRWALVESLVDHDSASIERSRFRGTVDRVLVGGREYSNKPPLLALAGAALYAPLGAATGWRIADPATGGRVIWLLTVLLVGLPAAATVALLDGALARPGSLGAGTRALITLALAAGTLLYSFAVTLNNHVPAAFFLLAATLAALDGRAGRSGLACGLAGALDLLPGFGFAPFLAGVLGRPAAGRGARWARFAAGIGAGAALSALANLATVGSLLPAKLLPGAVDLSAQAGPSAAGVVLPQSPFYALEILFGAHGLLAVSPVLLLGAIGLARSPRLPPFGTGAAWAWIGAGVAVQVAGHALVAGSYGGWSFGFRYLIPVHALLLLAAPAALAGRAARVAFAALLPASVLFAALGAYHPWPPAYEQATSGDPVAALVTNPIGGNAAAWLAVHRPGTRLAEAAGRRFVSPDPELRRRYFALFFGTRGDLATMRRFTR